VTLLLSFHEVERLQLLLVLQQLVLQQLVQVLHMQAQLALKGIQHLRGEYVRQFQFP
jgi:hypothetical protein